LLLLAVGLAATFLATVLVTRSARKALVDREAVHSEGLLATVDQHPTPVAVSAEAGPPAQAV
jgi:hypothetical protein